MEARKITIVSTRNQKKTTIMTSATTLSELKEDLRKGGVDYSGMTFYEGITKTELKDDSSVLPHDVPYKGTTTNELVFMLTNSNKKIRSGSMTRAEAYVKIKSMNLQEECVRRFGRNFTMCSTANLVALIDEYTNKSSKKVVKKTVIEETETTETPNSPVSSAGNGTDDVARKAIIMLVNDLYDNECIGCTVAANIKALLNGEEVIDSESLYSDDDIDEMFNFVRG